jgi:alkanesulfonate monooxygenase SsuD/methylene tetrahydromethanopterin reductase-like flavin-dependent oxidoreductase (luciferase family)
VTRQVRRLLDGERIVSSIPAGSRPLRLGVRPTSSIPIYIAALGPQAVRLAGELGDGWFPFLLPVAALTGGLRLLSEGAARSGSGQPLPQVCPGVPAAISPDPAQARRLASWWVSFYLTSMGPLYARTLRNLGLGEAVDAVLEANQSHGSAEVPATAQVLIDELTICGDGVTARAALGRWYAAGAQMPVVVVPPNRDLDELEHMLNVLRPP